MNAPHAEIDKNAIETARAFLKSEPFFTAKMEKDVNKLAQLLLKTWEQGAKSGARIASAFYDQEKDEWIRPWAGAAFNVILPPTDTDTETLPPEEKK